MSENYWYVDPKGERRGPVGSDEIARLIGEGAVTRDTLLWSGGMNDWRPAVSVTAFADRFAGSPAAAGSTSAARAPVSGRLQSDFPVWGLFWRSFVTGLVSAFVIPWPFITIWLYRWVITRISLPNGVRLKFTGRAGEIWIPFFGYVVAVIVLSILSAFVPKAAIVTGVLIVLGGAYFGFWLFSYICSHVTSEDGLMRIAFQGSFLGFLGWMVLLELSFVTIIGWAWVLKYAMRWMCRNVKGTHSFDFNAPGLAVLWRTLVGVLLCYLIIPIPWMIRWLYRWYISETSVSA